MVPEGACVAMTLMTHDISRLLGSREPSCSLSRLLLSPTLFNMLVALYACNLQASCDTNPCHFLERTQSSSNKANSRTQRVFRRWHDSLNHNFKEMSFGAAECAVCGVMMAIEKTITSNTWAV